MMRGICKKKNISDKYQQNRKVESVVADVETPVSTSATTEIYFINTPLLVSAVTNFIHTFFRYVNSGVR